MSRRWSRRSLLAVLGSLSLGGCLGSGAEDTPRRTTTSRTSKTPANTGRPGTPTGSIGDPEPPESIDADWPLPARDPGRSNYAPDSSGPVDPVSELWRVETDVALSSPIIHDETLYAGGADGVVRARDARTGESRWRQSVGSGAGTPRAVDGRLVVPTPDDVVSLDPSDGSERWRTDAPDRTGFLASHAGVYFVSGGESPEVVCLAGRDGDERWREAIGEPWTSTLFAGDDVLFVSTGTTDPRPWTLSPETGSFLGDRRPGGGGAHFPGARFLHDGIVFATDPFYGHVWAYEAKSDSYDRLWKRGFDGNPGAAHVAADSRHLYAYERGAGVLHALSTADGSSVWTRDDLDRLTARPVVARETVVVRTETALRCVDPADGTERWGRPNDDVGAEFVVADDLVYTTSAGAIRALRSH